MYVCVMQTEKIFIREDKSRVKIVVYFYIDSRYTTSTWDWQVLIAQPGKRKFKDVVNPDDHEYRSQSFPEGRNKWAKAKQLEYVTPEEVLEVKMDLWQQLKPTL